MMHDILQRYHLYLEGMDSSDHTIGAYMSDLKKFNHWYVGTTGNELDISAIGSLDIAEFKRYMINSNQMPATINRALMALLSFFSWAMSIGLVEANPVVDVKLVKSKQLSPRALDRLEQLALMRSVNASGKERDIAIITLMLHTGLRVSEVCNLQLCDLVLRERSGWLTVVYGKGGRWRRVPLNVTVRRALFAWLDVRGNFDGPLFISQKGGGLSRRSIGRIVKKYMRNAGLSDDISAHSLRHTFCKMLVDNGVSLDRVAVLAGHTNLNTTIRYTMPSEVDLKKNVESLSWE